MNNKKNKTIGVLGGMGPEVSSNLYAKIIKYAQHKYGAVQDFDYPPIIIYSLPLLGFDETGIVDEGLVRGQLIAGVKKLESAGAARDNLRQGAEAIIMGYIEIPLSINQVHTGIKLFDTIEIIVECAVDYSLGDP